MSYKFSDRSLRHLKTCDIRLQKVLLEAIKVIDFSVTSGHRSKIEQNNLYHAGQSKLKYPESKHNKIPSRAVDVAPYPIDYNDAKRFYYLIGIIKGIASQMDIELRLGCDWDGDNSFKDQSFHDLPHVELK